MNLLCRWKYRNIASPDGPVAEIDWTEIDLFGSPMYEVHVKLKDSLVKARDYKIHSNRDGFGTDQARDVALFKAFSESMEHWCFDQTVHSGKYGFNIDQTTNGMAFHPRKKLAETISEFEAVERWSVKNWWFGKAEHKLVNISDDIFGIEIISPFVGIRTAVIWKKSQSGTAYGFASHVSLDKAIQKAKIELHRNLRVLALGATIRVELLQERRILFFASQSGWDCFSQRLGRRADHVAKVPRLLFKGELWGEWSKFGTAWRHLYEGTTEKSEAVDVFVF